jgi:hypothetical protein
MKSRYREAELAGRKAGLSNVFYPMLNLIAAELVSRGRTRKPLDPDGLPRSARHWTSRCATIRIMASSGKRATMYEALPHAKGCRQSKQARLPTRTSMPASKQFEVGLVYDQAGFVLPRLPQTAKTEMQAAVRS